MKYPVHEYQYFPKPRLKQEPKSVHPRHNLVKGSHKQTITICGSMHFFKEIQKLQEDLQNLDFTVLTPNGESLDKDYSKMTIEEQIEMRQSFIDDDIVQKLREQLLVKILKK